ncbi:MAG: ASKHA domain-containing protein [Desulfomonilaceae bacterium]|nr:ASKHA domain-containing protein [Desulfomonilaceae bacterium]
MYGTTRSTDKIKQLGGSSTLDHQRGRHVWLSVIPNDLWLHVPRGITLWEALRDTDIDLESDCGGLGRCGKCRVSVVSALGPPTEDERRLLTEKQISEGVRLACRTEILEDMTVDVGDRRRPLEHYQILKTGHRPPVTLYPLVYQKTVSHDPDPTYDWLSDMDRIKMILGPNYRDLKPSIQCLRSLPGKMRRTGFHGVAVIHDNTLLDWQGWKKLGHRYGLAFDLGTSTLVGKLINLENGIEVGVTSRLNSQFKYGSNVVSRLQYVKERRNGLLTLNKLLVQDLNIITGKLLKQAGLKRDEIYIAVAAGNTTMQHLLLRLPPLGIAEAPFTPVLTDGLICRASEVNLKLNREALLYVMPTRSGYIGGDLIAVVLASDAAEQDREVVLGLDLGTNGEIFLGNRDRLLSCSAAAGPALEGAKISHGMIARTGAIEGVSFESNRLCYRTIGNTKPKGLCGSGLVDLVAVLLHFGIIDEEGLIVPPHCECGENLRSRVVERNGVCDFQVATEEESMDGTPIYVTQQDVRELQLAKGAVAAGIRILMEDLRIGIEDVGRVCLAGALGNYLHPLSAMRIGLIPRVDTSIVTPLGNAASAGASMVLLSKDCWKRAEDLSDFIEHVELSSRLDFNDYFVEHLDFPTENMW